jgi:hypothetical protein
MSDVTSVLLFWSLFAALAIFLPYFLTRGTSNQSGGASPGLKSAPKAPDGPIFVGHVGLALGLSLFSVAFFGNDRYSALGWYVGTVASFLLVGIVDILMGVGLLFTSKKVLARRTLACGAGVLGLGVLILFVADHPSMRSRCRDVNKT